MKKDIKSLDNDRALLITNCIIRNYLFWQKASVKYSDDEIIKNIYGWYSNLLHMLPTNYHGWKALFRQVRFDLKFLDGLTDKYSLSLLPVVQTLNLEIKSLLWLPTHMFKPTH